MQMHERVTAYYCGTRSRYTELKWVFWFSLLRSALPFLSLLSLGCWQLTLVNELMVPYISIKLWCCRLKSIMLMASIHWSWINSSYSLFCKVIDIFFTKYFTFWNCQCVIGCAFCNLLVRKTSRTEELIFYWFYCNREIWTCLCKMDDGAMCYL